MIPVELGWFDLAEYRAIGTLPPDFQVDAEGHTVDQGFVVDQRLRLGLTYKATGWRFDTEWDTLDGQVAGDTWGIRGDEDQRHREALTSFTLAGIEPRKLSVGVDLGGARMDLGLMTSSWGLGLVANDGAADPLFGRSDFGDRVVRARVTTKAAEQVTLVGALDVVAADDTARLVDDEMATQAVFAALYAGRQGMAGIYFVGRHQTENAFDEAADQRQTNVAVIDGYGQVQTPVGKASLRFAAEGAGIVGGTTRAESYTSPDALSVMSAGAAGRVELDAAHYNLQLRGGWASGDADPDDAVSQSFSFDRDFDVGMVLFDEVQGNLDAAAWAQMSDPENSGQPPDGAEQIVGEGALRGAMYLQPAVTVAPIDWIKVRAGVVAAWSSAPVQQAYATYRAGGVPTNHLGEATSGHYLGTEIDWALIVGKDRPPGGGKLTEPKPRPSLLVQGGHAFLSPDLGGERVDLLMVAGRLRL